MARLSLSPRRAARPAAEAPQERLGCRFARRGPLTEQQALRLELENEASEQRSKKGSGVATAAERLLPNRYFLLALENALRAGSGKALADFVVQTPCRPLSPHERRHLVELSA